MTRLLLITLLLLASGPAYGEWVSVSVLDQAGVTLCVDADTIRRKGDRVKMWKLIDYETIQTVAGDSFLSVRLQREHECVAQLLGLLRRRSCLARWEPAR